MYQRYGLARGTSQSRVGRVEARRQRRQYGQSPSELDVAVAVVCIAGRDARVVERRSQQRPALQRGRPERRRRPIAAVTLGTNEGAQVHDGTAMLVLPEAIGPANEVDHGQAPQRRDADLGGSAGGVHDPAERTVHGCDDVVPIVPHYHRTRLDHATRSVLLRRARVPPAHDGVGATVPYRRPVIVECVPSLPPGRVRRDRPEHRAKDALAFRRSLLAPARLGEDDETKERIIFDDTMKRRGVAGMVSVVVPRDKRWTSKNRMLPYR